MIILLFFSSTSSSSLWSCWVSNAIVLQLQAIELMVADALFKANDYLEISSYIEDPSQYWKVFATS